MRTYRGDVLYLLRIFSLAIIADQEELDPRLEMALREAYRTLRFYGFDENDVTELCRIELREIA